MCIRDRYRPYEGLYSVVLQTEITSSLKGNEDIYVDFKDRSLIGDVNGVSLRTEQLKGKALRQLYIPENVDSAGNLLVASTIITFILTVGLNPFKSSHSFWVFVNMMQFVSFLPAIDCVIPGNLELFITKYFGVSKVSIPFEYLPDWVPNPANFMKQLETQPLNEKFQKLGYTSVSFIHNFSGQFFTILAVALAYLGIALGSKLPLGKLYV
eukprot:TRINITY_DN2838_c0_g1_i1.p1 TRINITY_DN2838_c0_g1~~TRINITY_DN2838_c0_g1_i1.p1  ORF type:complete len:211 (-),score=49.39 TRINITY_DN2838_c0_g1_i1:204-836(-)